MKSDADFLKHILDEIQFVMKVTKEVTCDDFLTFAYKQNQC